MEKISFISDYSEGAHPNIVDRLLKTNLVSTVGYGEDEFSKSAAMKIRAECGCHDAEVRFLVGGTQTNAVVLGALLKPYEGVIAPESGHISSHEAGAIEFTGHKVFTVGQKDGKILLKGVEEVCEKYGSDENRAHTVMPAVVYISQPTEMGTIYHLDELTALKKVCNSYGLKLYVDGARLAYALAADDNDVTLKDLARLADAFYIGGTKCGTLLGEAVVLPDNGLIPHFFTIIKQRGALLAKGRILGLQFDELFSDGLYSKIGKTAIVAADLLRKAFKERGYELVYENTTNQVFIAVNDEQMKTLRSIADFGFWEKLPDGRTVVRFATSWATTPESAEKFVSLL